MLDVENYLFDKNKISTGIKGLDLMLLGGYKSNSAIAIIGGVEKTKYLFGYYFMMFPPSICVAIDLSPTEIIEKASEYRVDLSNVEFIDVYSKQAGVKPRKKDVVVSSISSLTDISISLTKLLEGKENPRVVFMSYSTLHTSVKKDSAYSFLNVIEGKIKPKNGSLMLIIDKFAHDKMDLKKLLGIVDEHYEIITKNNSTYIKGKNLQIPAHFIISPVGIEVL